MWRSKIVAERSSGADRTEVFLLFFDFSFLETDSMEKMVKEKSDVPSCGNPSRV